MECSICNNQILYVPPQERRHWWYDDAGKLYNAPLEKTNSRWVPYELGHVPLLVHEKHIFHRKCILEHLSINGKCRPESIYRKIFSKFIPCLHEPEEKQGECPLCRATFVTSQMVENRALTEIIDDADQMIFPPGYDPNFKQEDKPAARRHMMEIIFLIVVLYLTEKVMALGAFLFKKEAPVERRFYSIEAAKWYRLNVADFVGFEHLAESYFPREDFTV